MENVDMNKNVMGVYYSKSKYDVASIVAPFKGEIKKIFLLSYFLALQAIPGSYISCPSSRISSFSKEPWFCLLKDGIRCQH